MYQSVMQGMEGLEFAITSLGEERANLNGFRTFVRFVLVWICRFPLPLGVWKGLRFVIVALPGLFSFPLFMLEYQYIYKYCLKQCYLWKFMFSDDCLKK